MQRMTIPFEGINCPTRRRSTLYPVVGYWQGLNFSPPTSVTRSDYAANGGDVWLNFLGIYTFPEIPLRLIWLKVFADMTKDNTGVMFAGSEIRPADVTDGTSNTYLLGEKYKNPDYYEDGWEVGDEEAALIGDDSDITRWGGPGGPYVPCPDTMGSTNELIFGSAHSNGFNMAFCDGSVQTMSYSIDIQTHGWLCNRHDDHPVNPENL